MNSNQNQKLASEWFDAAENDYQYALLGVEEEHIYPQVGFSSQQFVEKILKGYLVLRGIDPPRIHDLQKLLNEASKINPEFVNFKIECQTLNGFYVESRYPPDIPDYTKDEILTALHAAENVRNFFKKNILGK